MHAAPTAPAQRRRSMRLSAVLLRVAWTGILCGAMPSCGNHRSGCDAILEPAPRVECRYERLQSFAQQTGRLELELAKVGDPTEHDLVALRLMVTNPSLFPLLCPRMKTASARQRCQRLEERPHLSERARRPDAGAQR